jgi:hypothetical protein
MRWGECRLGWRLLSGGRRAPPTFVGAADCAGDFCRVGGVRRRLLSGRRRPPATFREPPVRVVQVQSWRSVATGSSRAARRAGIQADADLLCPLLYAVRHDAEQTRQREHQRERGETGCDPECHVQNVGFDPRDHAQGHDLLDGRIDGRESLVRYASFITRSMALDMRAQSSASSVSCRRPDGVRR